METNTLKHKKLKKEFKDPFSGNNTGFAPATVTGAGATGSVPNTLAPAARPRPEFASDQEVVQFMDFKPGNIDCMEDFLNNWKTYTALSAFLAYSLKSVLPGMVSLAGKGIRGGYEILRDLSKGQGNAMKNALSNLKNLPSGTVSKIKTSARGGFGAADAMGDLYKLWSNAQWKNASNGARFLSAAKIGSRGIMIPINALKNVFVLAAVAAGVYYYGGGEKFLKWAHGNTEPGPLNDAIYIMQQSIEFFIMNEASLEWVLMSINQDLSKECRISNVVAGAIFITVMGVGAAKAKGMPTREELLKMSPDEIRNLILTQKGVRISEFSGEITKKLSAQGEKIGLNQSQLSGYIDDLLTADSRVALDRLIGLGIDPKKARKFQDASVKFVDSERAKFLEVLSKERKAQEALMPNRNQLDPARKAFRQFAQRALEATRKMNLDPQDAARLEAAASRSAISAEEMRELTRLLTGLPGKEKIFKVTTVDELAKSTKIVEDLLASGNLGFGESIALYKRVFTPQVEKMASKILDGTKHEGTLRNSATVAEKIEKLGATLTKFEQNQKLISEILTNLAAGEKSMPSLLDKVLKTNKAQKVNKINNLEEAKWAVDLAKREIIKLNPSITPDGLKTIDKTVSAAYRSVEKAAGAGKGHGRAVKAMVSAVFISIVSVVSKAIVAEDTDDLETWQRADLAKHLAWEGWLGPIKIAGSSLSPAGRSRADTYRINLDKLVGAMSGDRGFSAMNSIFKDYVFKENGVFVKMIIDKYKDQSDFNTKEVVNDFRIEKKKNENILSALQRTFGADVRGFGYSGLGGSDRTKEFQEVWHPILISIMIANSGIVSRLETKVRKNDRFWQMSTEQRKAFIRDKILVYNQDDVEDHLEGWINMYKKSAKARKNIGGIQMKENKKNDIEKLSLLVKEVISENRGQGYNTYPYSSQAGDPEEPAEDFIEDWKAFELSLTRDETRDTAIQVAKILVKDLELFGDVIDLVGKNQSVATEILKAMRIKEKAIKKA